MAAGGRQRDASAPGDPDVGSAILRVVAGKGGVGRTTVAAGLALRAAARGRRVLAIDAVGTGDLDRLLTRLGADPDGVGPGADLARVERLRLTTGEALDQYLRIYLRLPVGPRRLGPLARVFDYVSAAAPGVREILVVGKIGWEARNGPWDEIVVDGPATGHLVELLDAPRTMVELVPTGPLAEQTGWLREILASDQAGVVVVAGPDELSISESEELIERLRARSETEVRLLVANRQPPVLTPAGCSEAERLSSALGEDDAADLVVGRLAAVALDRHRVANRGIERLAAAADAGGTVAPIVRVRDDPAGPVGAVVEALEQVCDGPWWP